MTDDPRAEFIPYEDLVKEEGDADFLARVEKGRRDFESKMGQLRKIILPSKPRLTFLKRSLP